MKFIFKENKVESSGINENYRVLSQPIGWSNKTSSLSFDSRSKRDDKLLKSLWGLYQHNETAFAIVQSIVLPTLGEHFKINGVEENSGEFNDLNRAFKRAWISMYGAVRDTLIFGNSFAKIIRNVKGDFIDLKTLFPLDIEKLENNNSFLYKDKKTGKTYQSDEIFENVFFPRPDNIYAIPLLMPSKGALDKKTEMDSAISTAVARHMPRFHITVKPDTMNRYPSENEKRTIGNQFKKMASDQEFVSTDLIDINVLDTKSTIPSIIEYQAYFLNGCLMGSLVPAEMIGVQTRTGSFATSKVKFNAFLSFVIPYFQRILENNIKSQILSDSEASIDILAPSELAMPFSK